MIKKILTDIGRVIRYSITGKAKCYETVRILDGRILIAEDGYQIPIEEVE